MPAGLAPLVVGTFSPSVLVRVARRTGALDRAGLAVREHPVRSSPAQFAGLADGTLDAALTSPDNVIAYRFLPANPLGGTRDVRIVAAVDRGLGLALYAAPGTRSPADLRGSVLGVDVATSGFAFALLDIMAAAGLVAGQDYDLVELGSTPARLQALRDGRCAATMLNAGNDLLAEDAGMVRLADVTSVAAPYLGTVLAVQGEPTPQVRALAAALRETAGAVLDGSARGPAEEEARGTGLSAPLARRYVDGLADPEHGLVPDGAVDPAALDCLVALRRRHMPGAAAGPLARATDPEAGLVDPVTG